MRFLADECCEASLVEALRADGQDVLYAVESLPGASDDTILSRADVEGRILVTEDKDFGELVFRLKLPARGVILLRFDVEDRHLKLLRLRMLIGQYDNRLLGKFTVLEADKIRLRSIEA